MTEVLLIRHGQASFGTADYDRLSSLGHEQVALLASHLTSSGFTPTAVVRGSHHRHAQTVQTLLDVAGWSLTATVDERWNEYDAVDLLTIHEPRWSPRSAQLELLLSEALSRWSSSPDDIAYGETFNAYTARALDAFGQVVAHGGERVVVVTSGGVIGAVVADVLGTGTPGWTAMAESSINAAVTRLVREATSWHVHTLNGHGHLTRPDLVTER